MTFDFPRFMNSERTNEMTFNKDVAFEEIVEFLEDIRIAALIWIALCENEDQLLPRRKSRFFGIGNEVRHQI